MNKLFKIIEMELKITVMNKAFLIITIIGPILIIAISILPYFFSNMADYSNYKIGISGGNEKIKIILKNQLENKKIEVDLETKKDTLHNKIQTN